MRTSLKLHNLNKQRDQPMKGSRIQVILKRKMTKKRKRKIRKAKGIVAMMTKITALLLMIIIL